MLQGGYSIAGLLKARAQDEARGRLGERRPIAIIDIGSNSVRQVVYEGLTRAPSILFNEKLLCGLGKGVALNGELDAQASERALNAIRRFASLSKQLNVETLHVLATAAVREASNGKAFVEEVESICGAKVQLLSGRQEAFYAAQGVRSGFYKPDGIVGDLGGGSTELIGIDSDVENGTTMPLGALRLQQMAENDPAKARKIAAKIISGVDVHWPSKKKTLYAVGGTWRSIAHLYMLKTGYPLHVVHGLEVGAKDYRKFCENLIDNPDDFSSIMDQINRKRRDLVPFGAAVLIELINALEPEHISTSVTGLREGYLFSLLDEETSKRDALLEATAELSLLRARSPLHSRELIDWTNDAFETLAIEENIHQRRWRHAACNLADIVWRSASDFRAEQTLGIINNAGFTAISHEGRAFLAMVTYHRYQGLGASKQPPEVSSLVTDETIRLARVLAAMFRVLYLFSAAQDGLLPSISLERKKKGGLVLRLPKEAMHMAGEKPKSRLEVLSRELGEDVQLLTSD